MRVLLFSDPSNLSKLVSAAKSLSPEIIQAVTWERAKVPVEKLVIVKGAEVNDCWVECLSGIADEFDLIMFPATRDSREIAARLAVRKERPYISEVLQMKVNGGLLVSRMVFSGRGIEELKTSLPAIVTVNLDVYEPLLGEPNAVEETEVDCSPRVTLIDRKERKAEVDLTKAQVIVSVGRGLKKKEDLEMIKQLASLLGAEVACTRPISADFKWLPEERHVGMTGVRVKPKVYLALGISGQIQHVVGFRDAETVIAVNIDPDAPISEVSDYFVVGDLYEFVPKLIEEIKKRRGS